MRAPCIMDDCDKPTHARGLCNMHYLRMRKQGSLPERPRPEWTCQIDGCDRPGKAKGYCKHHYDSKRSHRPKCVIDGCDNVEARDGRCRVHQSLDGRCTVEGCDRPVSARGWCQMHYNRVRWHGSTEPRSRKRPKRPCRMFGCSKPAVARGLCMTHYKQARRVTQRAAKRTAKRATTARETLPPFRWTGWGPVTLIELAADDRPASRIRDVDSDRWRVLADGKPIGWLVTRDNGTRRFTYETPADNLDTIRPLETITRSQAVADLLAALNP